MECVCHSVLTNRERVLVLRGCVTSLRCALPAHAIIVMYALLCIEDEEGVEEMGTEGEDWVVVVSDVVVVGVLIAVTVLVVGSIIIVIISFCSRNNLIASSNNSG